MEKARASYVAVSPMQKARPSCVSCLANGEGESFSYVALCRQCRRRDLLVACLANGEGETFSYVARVRSCNANASGGLNFLASGYDGFHAKTNPLCE